MEQGFRKLLAWQKADDLAAEVFRLTENDLDRRHRWLALQAVRAAFSVTANIAEGYGRSSLGDYARFLELAGGSLNEVENALHFMKRNHVLPAESLTKAEELRKETGNLLFGLMKSLRSKLASKDRWQRGLIGEEHADYEAFSPIGSASLVPGSEFSDQVPSSKFPDPEGYHG